MFTYNSNSELGLDKNWCETEMWLGTHAHVQGREGTGSYGLSMSRNTMGTLVIPRAGASPHE